MHPTLRRLVTTPTIRLTLFTRTNCSLCDDSKQVLLQLFGRRDFHYDEIDVMAKNQQKWRELYEFDVPVLHIDHDDPDVPTTAEAKKLMHRFSKAEVEKIIDEIEKG